MKLTHFQTKDRPYTLCIRNILPMGFGEFLRDKIKSARVQVTYSTRDLQVTHENNYYLDSLDLFLTNIVTNIVKVKVRASLMIFLPSLKWKCLSRPPVHNNQTLKSNVEKGKNLLTSPGRLPNQAILLPYSAT